MCKVCFTLVLGQACLNLVLLPAYELFFFWPPYGLWSLYSLWYQSLCFLILDCLGFTKVAEVPRTMENKTVGKKGLVYIRQANEDIPRGLSIWLGALLETRGPGLVYCMPWERCKWAELRTEERGKGSRKDSAVTIRVSEETPAKRRCVEMVGKRNSTHGHPRAWVLSCDLQTEGCSDHQVLLPTLTICSNEPTQPPVLCASLTGHAFLTRYAIFLS